MKLTYLISLWMTSFKIDRTNPKINAELWVKSSAIIHTENTEQQVLLHRLEADD